MAFPCVCELNPLEGAGPVRFGMMYDQVLMVLGEPDQPLSGLWRSDALRAGWHNGGLAIHFDPSVEFIELSRGAGLVVKLEGIDVFRTPAADVVSVLVQHGHSFDATGRRSLEGLGLAHSYHFRDLQVALWRQVVPENEHDEEGRYFDTVGVAQRGYYT